MAKVRPPSRGLAELPLPSRAGDQTQIPHSPSPSEQWELQVVASFSGNDFDKWYSTLEVQDHKQDISEASNEAKNGKQAHVRKSARRELPILKTHLKLSEAAAKAVGA